MFDNLLDQKAEVFLTQDYLNNNLPNSILFSGPASSGKLTCALELSRILSCRNNPKGEWLCTCPSCLKHKALVSQDLIITGSRDCTLEIAASKETLLNAAKTNASYLKAAQYLFVRSVRKLTSRFNPVLFEGDDKLSKISSYTSSIDEILEIIDPLKPLVKYEELEKLTDSLYGQCKKLENSFMYNSLPVSQIRNISSWARYTIVEGKKIIIIENADRMSDSVRNALLKILEEPPEETLFILTTANRSAIIPTILSRVRTYNFNERTSEQQRNIIDRVFHAHSDNIDAYLLNFLPVEPDVIQSLAMKYWNAILSGQVPDVQEICKEADNFDPKILLRLFFSTLYQYQRKILLNINDGTKNASITEKLLYVSRVIKETYDQITVYNQTPASGLENLTIKLLRGARL